MTYNTAILLLICSSIMEIDGAPTRQRNATVHTDVMLEENVDHGTTIHTGVHNAICSLTPKDRTIPSKVKAALDDKASTIELHFKFRGQDWLPSSVEGKENSTMYKPYYWVWSRKQFSSRLLLVKSKYDEDPFVLVVLKDVSFKNIELVEEPFNCLDNITYDDFEQIMRETIINNYGNATSELFISDDSVCNLRIRNVMTENATFEYYCCQRDENMNMTCDFILPDKWFNIMKYVIACIVFIVFWYGPAYIPLSVVDSNSNTWYKLTKCKEISLEGNDTSSTTQQRHVNTDSNICRVRLGNEDMFIGADESPVSIISLLYIYVCTCRLRELESLEKCCKSSIFHTELCALSWHEFTQNTMDIITKLCLIFPMYIRVGYYYLYEKKEVDLREHAVHEKGNSEFTTATHKVINALHIPFIGVYAAFIILMWLSSKCLKSEHVVQIILRESFKDMNKNRAKAFGYIVQIMLLPFQTLGYLVIPFGVFAWIFLLPSALYFFCIHMIPTVNLILRFHSICSSADTRSEERRICPCSEERRNTSCCLLSKFESMRIEFRSLKRHLNKLMRPAMERKGLHRSKTSCILSYFFIYLLIIVFWYGYLSTSYILNFFMKALIYEFIGIVLYVEYTATYVTLFLIMLFYCRESFGSVYERYRKFNLAVNSYIQKNHFKDQNDIELTHKMGRGSLRNVAMLRANDGIYKIPTSLFFKACTMDYENAPGRPLYQYFKAALHFLCIVLFLSFVMLIVFAYGNSSDVSVSNQLLITVSGGFLPVVLRNCIFSKNDVQNIDFEKDTNFCEALDTLVQEYYRKESKHCFSVHGISRPSPSADIMNIEMTHDNEFTTQGVGDSCTHLVPTTSGDNSQYGTHN